MDGNNVDYDIESDLTHRQNCVDKEKNKTSAGMTQLRNMDNIWGNSPEFSGNSPSTSSHLQNLMHSVGPHVEDTTPNILLEQLAFVDNFMTDMPPELNDMGNDLNDGITSSSSMRQSLPADVQLALDERLAAELSIFADETFIFPDEDKNDINNWDNENSNSVNGTLNSMVNGRPFQDNGTQDKEYNNGIIDNKYDRHGSSNINHDNDISNAALIGRRKFFERRHILDRKSNLMGSQYAHAKQRFSKNRNSNHSSSVPDHSGFTNFDVHEPSTQVHQREAHILPSPLSSLLAAHELTSPKHVESSSSKLPTVREHPISASFQPNIQMPDYSNIQTSTLVSLLPRLQVPKGAYDSLRSVGFKNEQIDAIAAIMAYYEREKDKFENTGRASDIKKASSPTPAPSTYTDTQSSSATVSAPSQNVSKPFEDMLGQLKEKSEQFVSTNASSIQPVGTIDYATKEIQEKKEICSGQSSSSLSNHEVFNEIKDTTEMKPYSYTESTTHKLSLSDTLKENTTNEKKRSASTIGNSSIPSRPKLPDLGEAKKMKEKDMENWMNDFSELARDLKQRIQTLEMENRLLKDLVLDRGDAKVESSELSSKSEKS